MQIIAKENGKYGVIKTIGCAKTNQEIAVLFYRGKQELSKMQAQSSLFIFENDALIQGVPLTKTGKNMLEVLLACLLFLSLLFLAAHLFSLFSGKKIITVNDDGLIILYPPPTIYPIEKRVKLIKPPVKTVSKYVISKVTSEAVNDVEVLDHPETPVLNAEAKAGEGSPSHGMSTGTTTEVIPVVQPIPIVDWADVMPAYEGGLAAMMRFVQRNMKYPHHARVNGIEGLVYVQFVVNYEGKIVDVKVIRGISVDCDQEAARVIAMLPSWKPGWQNKMPVSVRMVLPINFKLEN